jgi:hypothetical protein
VPFVKFETITVRYVEPDFLVWPRTLTSVTVRLECMFYIQCKISRKWIIEHTGRLALLETLRFVLKAGICHCPLCWENCFFRIARSWKWVVFPILFFKFSTLDSRCLTISQPIIKLAASVLIYHYNLSRALLRRIYIIM